MAAQNIQYTKIRDPNRLDSYVQVEEKVFAIVRVNWRIQFVRIKDWKYWKLLVFYEFVFVSMNNVRIQSDNIANCRSVQCNEFVLL